MMTGFDVFDKTVQKSLLWLEELGRELRVDRHGAYRALRAVLHVFRDRLSPTEAVDLAAQMPMLVRGLYFEGWTAGGKPDKVKDADVIVELVRGELGHQATAGEARAAIDAVLRLLVRHLSAGELDDVRHGLPRHVRNLWPI